jgi:hypothetical protein
MAVKSGTTVNEPQVCWQTIAGQWRGMDSAKYRRKW